MSIMTKGNKGLIIGLILFTVIMIFASLVLSGSNPTAYADSEIYIAKSADPINVQYDKKNHHLILELSDKTAIATYAWYRSERENSAPIKVLETVSAEPSITVTDVTDSGYYQCFISAVNVNGKMKNVEIKSEKIRVDITPKPVDIKFDDTELIYSAEWLRPGLTINTKDIIEGDTITPYVETEIATIDAGTYNARIKIDNPNYTVKSNENMTYTIEKAPLIVKVKETIIKEGQTAGIEIVYEGLKGSDKAEDLGINAAVVGGIGSYSKPGIYDVVCTGEKEIANYKITYPTSQIYVNQKTLEGSSIDGIDATASGSFRIGTKLKITALEEKPNDINFLKIYKDLYMVEYLSGQSDGETYTLNINDSSISPFLLYVSLVKRDGTTERAGYFSYKDGVLEVTVPSDYDGKIAVYNDYTLLAIVGGGAAIIAIAVIIFLFMSGRKYKKAKYNYRMAEREADKFRPRRY